MIYWISNLRSTAILAVVCIHVSAIYIENNISMSIDWQLANFFNSFSRWSVPVLILISGYLLLGNSLQGSIINFYKKKLFKIVVPMLFWVFFYSCWNLIKNLFGKENDIELILRNILSGNAYYHLWYLYMLIPLYLLSPLFLFVLERIGLFWWLFLSLALLAFSIIMQAISGVFHQYETWLLWFIAYIPYFFIGGLLARKSFKVKVKNLVAIFLLNGFFIFLFYSFFDGDVFFGYTGGSYFYTYLSVNVVFMAICLFLFYKTSRVTSVKLLLPTFHLNTFGIYLIHPLILDVFFYLVKFSHVSLSGFYIPLITVVVFVLSSFVVNIFRRSSVLKNFI